MSHNAAAGSTIGILAIDETGTQPADGNPARESELADSGRFVTIPLGFSRFN
jgi:hypothetical protein